MDWFWKRFVCLFLGHDWPVTHVGKKTTNFGICYRCGKDSHKTVEEYVNKGYHNYRE